MGSVDELDHKEARGGLPSFVQQESHQQKAKSLNQVGEVGEMSRGLEFETGRSEKVFFRNNQE